MSVGKFASNFMHESESLPDDAPSPHKFEHAWLCPLRVEQEAAVGALDLEYDVDTDEYKIQHGMQGDLNEYRLGQICGYNVVICRPPDERAGPIVAAMGWRDLSRSFRNIRHLFIVGIGGGAPTKDNKPDVRLGDVVIGLAEKAHPGMIQLDAGHQNDSFRPLININSPPSNLHALAHRLINFPKQTQGIQGRKANIFKEKAQEILDKIDKENSDFNWMYPGIKDDCCFELGTPCVDSGNCPETCRNNRTPQRFRTMRAPGHQVVHGGLICSSSKVIRSAQYRDDTVARYQQDKGQILCFEMEGYGIASETRCLDIRGISDYSDCHKSSRWQPWAALHAAAAAKIITILLIESNPGIEPTKHVPRKESIRAAEPSSPRPKQLIKASTFGDTASVSVPNVAKRSATNPTSMQIVTRKLSDFEFLPSRTQNDPSWSESPTSARTQHIRSKSTEVDQPSGLNSSSPLHNRTPGRTRTASNQWQSGSPIQPDTITEEPVSLSDPFTSPHTAGLGIWPSPPETAHNNLDRLRTSSFQTHSDERSSMSVTNRVLSNPLRSYPANYMLPKQMHVPDINPESSCAFTIEIGELDSRQADSLRFHNFGRVIGCFHIAMHSDLQKTMPSKLLTFQYVSYDESTDETKTKQIQFWISVDEIDVTEKEDGLLVVWSDCESVVCRREDGRTLFHREYNARLPNIKLYIEFEREDDKELFRDKILNHGLEDSSWITHGSPLTEVKDAYDQVIKVFYRRDNQIRGAGILVTTVAPDSDGRGMKVFYVKPSFSTWLEHAADADGSKYNFKITGLYTLEYLVKPSRRDYFDMNLKGLTKNGRPDQQHVKEYIEADPGIERPFVKLSKASLPGLLEMIFDWKLVLRQHAASIRLNLTTSKRNLMLLHYKHDNGRLYILCCNMDSKPNQKNSVGEQKEWFLFEVNRNPKKGLSKKDQTVIIPIIRWAKTKIISLDQFEHRLEQDKLNLGINYATIEERDEAWDLYNPPRRPS